MADTAEEVKTEKAFDIGTGKYVEKPVEEKPEKPEKEEGKENKDEKKEEEKKPDPAPEVDYGKYLKEKFGAESEDELKERLGKLEDLQKELEEAKKPKEYEFKSPKEKAIADFLKEWDLDNVAEGIEFATTLMKIDPDKMDDKRALREKYIYENSEVGRDKAIKLFESEYKKLYDLSKDDYDNDEDFKEAQELSEIKKEKEAMRAKKFLAEKKESLKYKAPEKKEDKTPEKPEPRITEEVIAPYQKQIDSFFKPKEGEDFDRFIFQHDDETIPPITLVIPEDKLKVIRKTCHDWLRMEGNYDNNKKLPNFDPQRLVKQVTDALFGDWKDEQMLNEVTKLAKILRAEQLAGVKPTKKSGGQGKEGIPSIEEQLQELAKKEKASRAAKK
jgi:hypothetical protein